MAAFCLGPLHGNAQTLTTLYSFSGSDGANPSSLVPGSDGNFYGVTGYGGTNGDYGTVFKITPGGVATTLHSFSGSDGTLPYASLVQGSNGSFYGTTLMGGTNGGYGTVFTITSNGFFTTLYSFSGSDGQAPIAGLIQGSDGDFYGTTEVGGTYGAYGTVFKITSDGILTTLYSFSGGTNGHTVYAGLVQGRDGDFYGATFYGGANNDGTVFKITPGGVLTTLYSFSGSDGLDPESSLIQGYDGNLYGTTVGGGTGSLGTVFMITPEGALTNLHSFSGSDGGHLENGLVQGHDGHFYGVTYGGGNSGGPWGKGTIFRITPRGEFTNLYFFSGADGLNPLGHLIQGGDGNLYGTTDQGGVSNKGTVFKLSDVPAAFGSAAYPAAGPSSGGNTITITAGPLGNGTDITNVTVGGVAATIITQGVNWVAITIPVTGTAGVKDIVIQSASVGDTTFVGAYTVNPAGQIGGVIKDWTQWEEVAGLPAPRRLLASGMLNGALYAIGGWTDSAQTNVYRYDGTNWTEVAGLPAPRSGTAAGVLNGALYAIGGFDGGGPETNVYRYDGTNWTEVAGLPTAQMFLAASELNGVLYAVGGLDSSITAQTNVYRYDGTNWTEVAGLLTPRATLAAGVLNGALYAMGGVDGGGAQTNVHRYDGTNWTEVAGLSVAREGLAAGVLNDALYAVGGRDSGGLAQTNVYRYNGANWTEVAGLPTARWGLAAGVLNDALYAVGGGDGSNVAQTNVYRYPRIAGIDPGVSPSSGSYTGGYSVVITGTNLCDGTLGDIISVTLCGVTAAVTSVSGSTQIVVTAGAGIGLGDVVVQSTSYGTTAKSNAFDYTAVLTIASAYGSATPAVGVHTNTSGTAITNFMASPEVLGTTQYVCTGWIMTGNEPLTGTTTNVVMTLTNNAALTWLWKTNYWLAPTSMSANGSVNMAPGWQPAGSNVSVTATPSNGYHFVNWTGTVNSVSNPIPLSMTQPISVVANFSINTNSISATNGPGGTITPSGVIWVDYGSSTNFAIAPNANYHITNVIVDGASVGMTSAWTFANVTNAHTINALFGIDQYTLTVYSFYSTSTWHGVTTNAWNTSITVRTDSVLGNGTTQHVCTGWTGSGNVTNGAGTNVTFNLTTNSTLTWLWATNYWLAPTSLSVNGSVNMAPGFFPRGSNVSVTATPSNGYHFVNWTGTVSSVSNPIPLTMTQPISIVANFSINTNSIFRGLPWLQLLLE